MVSPSSDAASGSRLGLPWEEDGPTSADEPENVNDDEGRYRKVQ